MRHLPLVLLLLAWVPGVGAPARADEHAAAPTRILPSSLASPARVHLVLEERLAALPASGPDLVRRVCQEGGPAALHALAFLARHANAEVRRAALQGAAQLRLRSETLREAAERVLASGAEPVAVHVAALEVLGWSGDARDVPRLLESALDARAEVAGSAQVAFRNLTGVGAIARDAERREAWWVAARASGLAELELALDGIEGPEAGSDLGTCRRLLALRAMHDIPGTTERLRTWLRSSEAVLRREGLRAIATLRLADLASEVASLTRFASSPDLVQTAEQTLALLGVPLTEVR
jgi:hypothetical protein